MSSQFSLIDTKVWPCRHERFSIIMFSIVVDWRITAQWFWLLPQWSSLGFIVTVVVQWRHRFIIVTMVFCWRDGDAKITISQTATPRLCHTPRAKRFSGLIFVPWCLKKVWVCIEPWRQIIRFFEIVHFALHCSEFKKKRNIETKHEKLRFWKFWSEEKFLLRSFQAKNTTQKEIKALYPKRLNANSKENFATWVKKLFTTRNN